MNEFYCQKTGVLCFLIPIVISNPSQCILVMLGVILNPMGTQIHNTSSSSLAMAPHTKVSQSTAYISSLFAHN